MSNNEKNIPKLFILMRSDLKSLNAGKAMAQAAHAANQLHDRYFNGTLSNCAQKAFEEWKNQGDGFGITIVLDCYTETHIDNSINRLKNEYQNFPSNKIIDGSYPISDGPSITHIVKDVCTCAWVFSVNGESHPAIDMYGLYK